MSADTFDMEQSPSVTQQAASARQRPSQLAQFAAVLKKNFIIQTRSRKTFFGIGGWTALLFEMFVPGLFFLLMCIPKYYVPLSPSPRQLSAAYSLDSNSWARPYHGMSLAHAALKLASLLHQCSHHSSFPVACRACRAPQPCGKHTLLSQYNRDAAADDGFCKAGSMPAGS